MKKYFNKFFYLIPILLVGLSIFLSNRTTAQDAYWPWVDLAFPNYTSNITSNGATFNGTLSFASAMDARDTQTRVWFEYYKWYGDYNTVKYQTSQQTIYYNGGQEYPRFSFSANVSNLEPNTNYCVQAKAINNAGTAESTALCFTTLASGSSGGSSGSSGGSTSGNLQVVTKGTNGYGQTWANLQGEITQMTGISKVDYYFVYRKEAESTTKATGIYQRTNLGTFDIQVNDLLAGTRYCYKAVAKDSNNPSVISQGSEICFTTQSSSGSSGSSNNFVIQTRSTNDYGINWAILKGEITQMTGVSKAEYYFIYKKDGSASSQASGIYTTTATGPVQIQVNNLDPGSRYCYKAVAKDSNNPSVISQGSEICFTTNYSGNNTNNSGSNINSGLNVNTLPYDYIADNYAILRGEITNMGYANRVDYWFKYYKSGNSGNSYSTNVESKYSIGGFSLGVYGLSPDTQYCYKAMAANSSNSNEWDEGTEHCFRTLRSGQTGQTGSTSNESYITQSKKVCYKKVIIYIDTDSAGNKIIWTRGLVGNNNAVQRFSSEASAKDYINSLETAYNQCSVSESQNTSSSENKKRYYCKAATGECVTTNSSYPNISSCEYSLKTYLPGISTNVCFDTTQECSKYCRKTSSGSGASTGNYSQDYQRSKYYYCRTSDKTCVATDGTYANVSICSQSLNIYKPGISTGMCFQDLDTCSKSCSGTVQNSGQTAIQNQIVVSPPCQSGETRIETLAPTDILEKSMQFNGRLLCIADKNTSVGFEYYGKSETAMSPKQIFLSEYKILESQLKNVLEFKTIAKDLEQGITYCYKAIAKVGTQTLYGNEICYPEDKRTAESCEAVVKEYITEPFSGLEDCFVAFKENCPNNISEECFADKDRGFIDQMEEMGVKYQDSKKIVLDQVKKATNRKGLAKFFIGPNWKAIKAVEKYLEENKTRIEELKDLKKEFKSQCSTMSIERTIKLLEDENSQISDNLAKSRKGFSLFGWLFKLFS
ncbi:MAG TPA: hypothetical protein PLA41_00070 [Candidatus Pacearchaeota archaeon]|nr:hypothetical protein [Candidatus Parcubacteria bacterium]HOU45538.1 hypothetical protein [Candidatus Pacearchaeota archaeon]HPM08583.1 hypothetical protein [Candidatus Pacearchaeota archaeon]HQI74304.1 hypothetical protein [Candidatus Pacearchaeota archaeon]